MNEIPEEILHAASERGIDLINGNHNPIAAEAARRAGLELLRFPDWTAAMYGAMLEKLQEIDAETERLMEQNHQLGLALAEHKAAMIKDLPIDVLCRIYRCTPGELPAILNAPVVDRWFEGGAR